MAQKTRLSTGIGGLDEVLHGGLLLGHSYMLRGEPGAGKTLVALQYLQAGVDNDEDVLMINLEEPTEKLRRNSAAIGLEIDQIECLDLTPGSEVFAQDQAYDIFDPSDVEQGEITGQITERIQSLGPSRVVIDPLTQLRDLAPDEYQFRKQVLSLATFVGEQETTLLFTTQPKATPDTDLQFLADGTLQIDRTHTGRMIGVPKFRGSDSHGGPHALELTTEGVAVYPQLQPSDASGTMSLEHLRSGVPELDELLNGGIEAGTTTIISGPSGVGKTTAGTQFMKEAAGRGEQSVIYMFEENIETFLTRSRAIGIPVEQMRDNGALILREIEPLAATPQEFAQQVRDDVRTGGSELVMIDGLTGYITCLRGDETGLRQQVHALLKYLKNSGVTTLLIDEIPNVTGDFQPTNKNISYLADNVVFLRHLEINGELRKAIGVLKKRTGDFERTLREFEITEHGIKVGAPLTDLHGILQGTPELRQDGSGSVQ